jgi:hypothetical protein
MKLERLGRFIVLECDGVAISPAAIAPLMRQVFDAGSDFALTGYPSADRKPGAPIPEPSWKPLLEVAKDYGQPWRLAVWSEDTYLRMAGQR